MPNTSPQNTQSMEDTESSSKKGKSKQKTEKTVYLKIVYELFAADPKKVYITNNEIVAHAQKNPAEYPIVATQPAKNMIRVFDCKSTGLIRFGFATIATDSYKKHYHPIFDDQKLIAGYLTKQSPAAAQNYQQFAQTLSSNSYNLNDDSVTTTRDENTTYFTVHRSIGLELLYDFGNTFYQEKKSIDFTFEDFEKFLQSSNNHKVNIKTYLAELKKYGFIIAKENKYQILVGANLLKSILDVSYPAYRKAQVIHGNNNNNNNNVTKSISTTSTVQTTPVKTKMITSPIVTPKVSKTIPIFTIPTVVDTNLPGELINENNTYFTQNEILSDSHYYSAGYLQTQTNANQNNNNNNNIPPTTYPEQNFSLARWLPEACELDATELDVKELFDIEATQNLEISTTTTTTTTTPTTKKHKIENPEEETKSPKGKKHKIKTSKKEIENEITKREQRLIDDPSLCIDPSSLPLPTKNDQKQDDLSQEQYINPKETTLLYLPSRIRLLKFLRLNLEDVYSECHEMDTVSRAELLQKPLDSKDPLNFKIIKITEQEFVKLSAKNFKSLGDKSFKLKTNNPNINSVRTMYNKIYNSSDRQELLLKINNILNTSAKDISDNSLEKAYLLYIKAKLCSEQAKFYDAIKLFKDAYKICRSLEINDQQNFIVHQQNALLILWNLEFNINLFCDQKRADLEPSSGNRVKLKPIDDQDQDVIFPENLAHMVKTIDDINIVQFPQGDSLAIMLSEDFTEKDLNKTKWQTPNYEIADRKMKKINACNSAINARIIYETFDVESNQLDDYIDSIMKATPAKLKHKPNKENSNTVSYANNERKFWNENRKISFDVSADGALDKMLDQQIEAYEKNQAQSTNSDTNDNSSIVAKV